MKFDIYSVINESKDSTLFNLDEINKLYSFANDNILFSIIAKDEAERKKDEEQSLISKFAEIILKNRDNYWSAKNDEKLDDFKNELTKEIRKKIKHDRKKTKKELFKKMNEIAANYDNKVETTDNPNSVIFKLFLNDYNSKYAFTWKAFKETKKLYEKSHILEGEDIYVLKSLLEKDPKINKINDSTVFSKSNHTLSNSIIEKIKEKIG